MNLGQPDRVETPAIGGLDLVERLGERRRLGLVGPAMKFMVDADFHVSRVLFAAMRLATLKSIAPSSKCRIPIMFMPL